ncbi:MAG TPA: protein kinase, partial [Polyangiaceae bacterium]
MLPHSNAPLALPPRENSHSHSALALARVGTVVREKWRLDRLLGVGGMAAVFAAMHRNGNRVAIKMLHRDLADVGELRTRFLREGYLANAVEHPGAVSVLDDDATADGTVFLVMELLEGETLERRWERNGRQLPVLEVLSAVDGLLDVLAAAHAKGLVHRDVKPENVF